MTRADGSRPTEGRPLKFKTVKELQERIDAYFADCDPHIIEVECLEHPKKKVTKDGKAKYVSDYSAEPEIVLRKQMSKQVPYTITGLALYLDTTRETLLDYENKDEFSDAIKRAKIKCQNYAELSLFGSNATGPIFNLKNNYGWRDKTEVDQTVTGDVAFINDVPRPKDE